MVRWFSSIAKVVLALGALALGACSGLRDSAPTIAPGAGYKVGKPYRIGGVQYVPRIDPHYDERGIASWYGPGFDGKRTANGEIYDMDALTAAHTTLPLPSLVRVDNLENGRSVVLKVNDRGPFARGRIIDVSRRAAEKLGFRRQGTARVRVRVLDSPAFRNYRGGGDLRDDRDSGDLYVQAGAFRNSRNAWRLQARLSRIRSFEVARRYTSGGLVHRVRAGPLLSRAEARALLSDLRAAGYRGARVIRD